jgi:anti-anti-sigma factor
MEPVATPLEIVIAGTTEDPLLVLTGEIDVASVVGLRTAVDELPRTPCPIAIDLAGVTFMDSTGLGWLAGLARGGCEVTLVGTPEPIRKLLDVTGVGSVVTLADA